MRSREASPPTSTIDIELLALDLEACGRCTKTAENLDQALRTVSEAFRAAAFDVRVTRTIVRTAADAERLRFVSSPTIRVNGRDIALELRESACGDCSALCGCGTGVQCRDWIWRGQAYQEAPTAMIVDALLRSFARADDAEVAPEAAYRLPDNLRRFFGQRTAAGAASCGSSASGPGSASACCPAPAPADAGGGR